MIPTREQYQAIGALDLSGISARLVYKEGFELQRAVQAVEMYKQFLRMVLVNNHSITVPNEDADKAWHHHILNTQAYEADCQKIFGKFLHHDPEFYDTPAFAEACKETQNIAETLCGADHIFIDMGSVPESNSAALCGGMLKDERQATGAALCGGKLKDERQATGAALCGGMLKDERQATGAALCGGMLKDTSKVYLKAAA